MSGAVRAVQEQASAVVTFALVEASALHPHEQVDCEHLNRLRAEIATDGALREPVLVDARTMIILDGHHRAQALIELGCCLVPSYLVDYASPLIQVGPWREGVLVDKQEVIQRGMRRDPLPPRTSRHTVSVSLRPRPTALSLLGATG